MIINLDSLSSKKFVEDNAKADMNVRHMDAKADSKDLIVPEMLSHPSNLGPMIKGVNKHFYSVGGFNLIQLIFYVLRFTGPANLFLTSYSISVDSINALRRKADRKEILSVKFLIDNRVRSISPKPFDVNLEVDELEFDECVKTPGTDARKAFYRGFIKQQSELREALIKSAMNGSNPAQQELLKLRDKLIQYE